MNINRNNYEVFFLMYIDRELSNREMQVVEEFLREHPDLQEEMEMLAGTVLTEDLNPVSFPDKSRLFRTDDNKSLVNISNYESYFVLYADDELTNEEKAATEKFVYDHPECQAEFEAFQKAKLTADTSIVFHRKEQLFRREESTVRRIFPVWTRYAAAALLLLTLSFVWLSRVPETAPLAQDQPGKPPLNEISEEPAATAKSLEKQALAAVDPKPNHRENNSVLPKVEEIENSEISKQLAYNTPKQPAAEPIKASLPEEKNTVKLPSSGSPALKIEEPVQGSLTSLVAADEKIIPVVPNDQPLIVVAMNENNGEDETFAPGKEMIRKTPLRGLLRKAGRYLGKTNPFSEDRGKSGVFTASNEQQ